MWMCICLFFFARHYIPQTAIVKVRIGSPKTARTVVKVRGLGGLSPLFPFEPPAIV